MTSSKHGVKDSKKAKKEAKESKPMTKIVIRRLPPKLKEEDFLEAVNPLPEHDDFRFVPANEDVFCGFQDFARAYVNFVQTEDLFQFKEKFDGYVFIDSAGNESQCLIEYAPYQKIPNPLKKTKVDAKANTIDEDQDFLAFVEEFQKKEQNHQQETPEQFLEIIEKKEREAKSREQNTNLLNFIKESKAEKFRIRQEKYEARKKKDDERRKAKEETKKKRKERQKAEIAAKTSSIGSITEDAENLEEKKQDKGGKSNFDKKKGGKQDHAKADKQKSKKAFNKSAPIEESTNKSTDGLGDQVESGSNSGTKPKRPDKKNDSERKPGKKTEKAALQRGPEAPNFEESPKIYSADELEKMKPDKKDKKEQAEKKAKNKERPAMQIYRPGMGKFSSQTISKPEESSEPDNSSNAQVADSGKKYSKSKTWRNSKFQNKDQQQLGSDQSEPTQEKVYTTREFRRSNSGRGQQHQEKVKSLAKEEDSALKKSGKSYASKRKERQQMKEAASKSAQSEDSISDIPPK